MCFWSRCSCKKKNTYRFTENCHNNKYITSISCKFDNNSTQTLILVCFCVWTFPWMCVCVCVRVTSTPLLRPKSTHPFIRLHPRVLAESTTFPSGGEQWVCERESDWLTGLASSPTVCQLAVYSSTVVGIPASLACCLISDPHTRLWWPLRIFTSPTIYKQTHRQTDTFWVFSLTFQNEKQNKNI